MNQINSWQNKITVKKGNIGEDIVRDFLIGKGFIPYIPEVDGAHPFDKLCASKDKKTVFIAEVKAKARRNYYPDTGIDIRSFNDYMNIKNKYNINIFIFFVDEMEKRIYGNWLSILTKRRKIKHKNKLIDYPKEEGGIIYFPIEVMKYISNLTEEQINILKETSTRNYKYKY